MTGRRRAFRCLDLNDFYRLGFGDLKMMNPLTRLLLISTVAITMSAKPVEGAPQNEIYLEAGAQVGWSEGSYGASNSDGATFSGPGAFSGILSIAPPPPSCGCGAEGIAYGAASIEAISNNEWVFNGDSGSTSAAPSSASCVLRFQRNPSEGGSVSYELALVGKWNSSSQDVAIAMVDGSWSVNLNEAFGSGGSAVTVPAGGDFEVRANCIDGSAFHFGLRATAPTTTVVPSYAHAAATTISACNSVQMVKQFSSGGVDGNCGSNGGASFGGAVSAWNSLGSDQCICHAALTLSQPDDVQCSISDFWTQARFDKPCSLILTAMTKSGSASFPFDPALLPLEIPGNSTFNLYLPNTAGSLTLYFDYTDEGESYCWGDGSPWAAYDDCNGDGIPDICQPGHDDGTDCNGDGIRDFCQFNSFTDANGNQWLDACEIGHGDFNLDGHVNAPDLTYFLSQWGGGWDNPADLNGDGTVGLRDLTIMLTYWG